MKYFPVVLCVLVLFTGCYSPERDCASYRTGTFEFETYLNGEIVTSRFVRNDSIEIDHFQGKTDTSSVRWLNDCEYIIKNLNPKNRAERQPIHIKILTTGKDSYTFEYGLVGDSQKEKGEVKRIE
ncbi:DNA topoisomerase IV [Antarcticibacterium flavum]|uniref:DNA topoisomerase IV n=1 Tax=Antarcticibacterium flavum TaxID=2058175 RepID=A0A5B7WXP1_9FLAO|nr:MULTISPECIES: DNA topoisomerase IV [Antarcticibacterium]MCM4160302.1 DNA topoisomerase IV [Antarcticibacterium sp. W02-3]QCY67924.1 DNA topoisomerase IV [Antarcticibacterium flavum]